MFNITGEVVRVPGLPFMHDYEYYPQDVCPTISEGYMKTQRP